MITLIVKDIAIVVDVDIFMDMVEENIMMVFIFKNTKDHQKWQGKRYMNGNEIRRKDKEIVASICYLCRGNNHCSHTCHMEKHLLELYQQSLKNKGKIYKQTFFSTNGNVSLDS